MRPIAYTTGDATAPPAGAPAIIAHVCNDAGGWGKGFVLAISRRWPEPERAYRRWYAERASNDFALGALQIVPVAPAVSVANLVAQRGTRPTAATPMIRYDALERALASLADEALARHATVHMPRIGCGLAGGTWDRVEPIISRTLSARDVAVTVYDLPPA